MEATFQSYLTEAVFAIEAEKLKKARTASKEADISYIDADFESDEVFCENSAKKCENSAKKCQNSPKVKLRENNRGRRRGQPRPSGLNLDNEEISENQFKRNSNFFTSFNTRKKRYSPPIFYLQRSQSTKEVGSRRFSTSSISQKIDEEIGENHDFVKKPSNIFRQFALKRTRTWGSLVASLNRSFRNNENNANNSNFVRNVNNRSTFYTNWRRSQSLRNIEKIFSSRR